MFTVTTTASRLRCSRNKLLAIEATGLDLEALAGAAVMPNTIRPLPDCTIVIKNGQLCN